MLDPNGSPGQSPKAQAVAISPSHEGKSCLTNMLHSSSNEFFGGMFTKWERLCDERALCQGAAVHLGLPVSSSFRCLGVDMSAAGSDTPLEVAPMCADHKDPGDSRLHPHM